MADDYIDRLIALARDSAAPYKGSPVEVQRAYAAGARAMASFLTASSHHVNRERGLEKGGAHKVIGEAVDGMVRALISSADVVIPPEFER